MNVASRIYWGASGTLVLLVVTLLLPASSLTCIQDVLMYTLCLAFGCASIWIAALCKEKKDV